MDIFKICPTGWRCVSKNTSIVCLSVLASALLLSTIVLAVKLHRNSNSDVSNTVYAPLVKEKTLQHTMDYFRLPKDVKPTKYTLELNPNLANKTFMGTVGITMQVLRTTKHIKLHIKDLNIYFINLKSVGNETIAVQSYNVNTVFELLELNLEYPLTKGNYELHVKFNGSLDKGIVGLYASSLKSGKTMIASKFQPTYARQAFPCFDEPDFKATFDITLVKPTDFIALSNMNEISKKYEKETNSDIVKFATSVPMSTYLVCFVICNFDHKETVIDTRGIGENFTLRSFAQKNETHKIDFAQDIGKRATEFYIQYYNVPFPLPKLDMIAIPDYVSGATEHWGLVTYRETSFLVDKKTASSKNKMSVANTIAHELAHMWFGNLVTMKWWDEVWLNEGFASYMQVKALNAIEPSWTMLDQFLTKTLHPVLVTDSKVSSHPIVQKVETPDQITAIFDAISYNKGASILRMLEGFIGEEKFRKGVTDYLRHFEFRNSVTSDLLTCLDEYFKTDNPTLNLTHIMDTWTKQMGYPVLNVAKGISEKKLIVTQRQFLLDSKAVVKENSEFYYRWFVPITYKTNKGASDGVVWFPDDTHSVEIPLESDDKWIKLNNNQVGFYRVNYSAPLWAELTQELKAGSEKLTISDRANLLNDVFALADANALPYEVALELSTYLRVEGAYVPWDAASAIFNKLADSLMNSPAHADLERFIQHLIKPLYEKQSWKATSLSVIDGLLRTKVLSLAASHHLPEAEAKVRKLFLDWLNSHCKSRSAIEPDLRDFVYYCGMRAATAAEWNKLWNIYLHESDVQEQAKLRLALAAPRDADILKKYLSLAWDEKNIRSQDYLNVLSYISANPSGAGLVWDEVRARWPQLVERFTLNSRYLGGLIPSITSSFNTLPQLKEMESFFEEHPNAGAGESARRRALENVRNNIKWSTKHKLFVAAWLKDYLKTI